MDITSTKRACAKLYKPYGMTTKSKLHQISQAQLKHWVAYLVLWVAATLLVPGTGWLDFFSADASAQRSFGALVAQLAGGFAGTAFTALAIVFALPDRPVLRDMRATGHFLDLSAWVVSIVVIFLMVCALGSLVSILEDPKNTFAALLTSIIPLGFILLQGCLRLAITFIHVARPDQG